MGSKEVGRKSIYGSLVSQTKSAITLVNVSPAVLVLHTRTPTGKLFGPTFTLLLSKPTTFQVIGVTVRLAVANTLAAVSAGVRQVQGTINGYGERCGNANLCSIIPDLKLKMGIDCVTDTQLARLTEVSNYVSELANLAPDAFLPYVGPSAFSHKGGIHVSGMAKWGASYQHINPSRVGNRPHVVVSELAGKGSIIFKAKERGLPVPTSKKL
jgi:hypothetical protein